jgi:hypothetical protein
MEIIKNLKFRGDKGGDGEKAKSDEHRAKSMSYEW